MFGKFKNNEKKATSIIDQLESNPLFQFHRSYWQFDGKEKERPMNKYPNDLSSAELLRLHHLNCLEHVSSERGKAQFDDSCPEEELFWLEGPSKDLCTAILEKLLDKGSPYRPRQGMVWQGKVGDSGKRAPDLQGEFYNASLTHIGCLEVIRVDEELSPKEIAFLPFDEIQAVVFDQPSFYRAAKIFYEYQRGDEIVFVPLIYGLSWLFKHSYLHDGSFTKWGCNIESKQGFRLGIGSGHQDFKIVGENGKQTLFGLSSIGEIIIPIDIGDPKFETKCRARGMDPDDVKKQIRER